MKDKTTWIGQDHQGFYVSAVYSTLLIKHLYLEITKIFPERQSNLANTTMGATYNLAVYLPLPIKLEQLYTNWSIRSLLNMNKPQHRFFNHIEKMELKNYIYLKKEINNTLHLSPYGGFAYAINMLKSFRVGREFDSTWSSSIVWSRGILLWLPFKPICLLLKRHLTKKNCSNGRTRFYSRICKSINTTLRFFIIYFSLSIIWGKCLINICYCSWIEIGKGIEQVVNEFWKR